jgi:hypothetical protein
MNSSSETDKDPFEQPEELLTEFDTPPTPEPKKAGKAAHMHSRRLRMAGDVEAEYWKSTDVERKIRLGELFHKLSQAPRKQKKEKPPNLFT